MTNEIQMSIQNCASDKQEDIIDMNILGSLYIQQNYMLYIKDRNKVPGQHTYNLQQI